MLIIIIIITIIIIIIIIIVIIIIIILIIIIVIIIIIMIIIIIKIIINQNARIDKLTQISSLRRFTELYASDLTESEPGQVHFQSFWVHPLL